MSAMKLALAIAIVGALAGVAQANQAWDDIVRGIARLPLPERAEAAQRAAAEFMGPPPKGDRQRLIYAENLERQRQLMLSGVASIERRAHEDLVRRLAEEDAAAARRRAANPAR